MKTFKLTLTTSEGEVLDSFEIAIAGSKAAMLESCEEEIGRFGSSSLCERLVSEIKKAQFPFVE
jgi:hypothetical protein